MSNNNTWTVGDIGFELRATTSTDPQIHAVASVALNNVFAGSTAGEWSEQARQLSIEHASLDEARQAMRDYIDLHSQVESMRSAAEHADADAAEARAATRQAHAELKGAALASRVVALERDAETKETTAQECRRACELYAGRVAAARQAVEQAIEKAATEGLRRANLAAIAEREQLLAELADAISGPLTRLAALAKATEYLRPTGRTRDWLRAEVDATTTAVEA